MSQARAALKSIFRTFLLSIASVLITSVALHALGPDQQSGDGQITVVATVAPARYLIVDNSLQITQVVSNTQEDTLPTVLLNSLDGQAVPYTDSIRTQYTSLKSQIDFSKAGVVYKSESGNLVMGALRSLRTQIQRFVFG